MVAAGHTGGDDEGPMTPPETLHDWCHAMAAKLSDADDALHGPDPSAAAAILSEARAVVVCPPGGAGGQDEIDWASVPESWEDLAAGLSTVIAVASGFGQLGAAHADDPALAAASLRYASLLLRPVIDQLVRDDGQVPDLDRVDRTDATAARRRLSRLVDTRSSRNP